MGAGEVGRNEQNSKISLVWIDDQKGTGGCNRNSEDKLTPHLAQLWLVVPRSI